MADVVVEKTEKKKKVYSRKEFEELRNEEIEWQKKKWIEVYCGLGTVLQKEYDELAVNYENHSRQHREELNKKKKKKSKHESPLILGEESSQSTDNKIVNTNTYDTASDLVNDKNSCVIDQGECTEVDDSDDDYSGIQKMALFVTGEPDFDSGPPEDGLEYLRRVRWEAARLPKVKIAKVDRSKPNKEQTVYMPQIPDIAKCPKHLLPLKEWEDAFLADFSKLRLIFSRFEMSKANDDDELLIFSRHHEEETSCKLKLFETTVPENHDMPNEDGSCQSIDIESSSNPETMSVTAEYHGSSLEESSSLSSSVPSGTSVNCPTLSTIIGMDAVARVTMLKKHINMAETKSSLSMDECLWLFALCAAVDTPLHAETSAALRSLLRKCASLRTQKSELDEEVVMLNILATISGRYFGQSEN